MGKQEEAIRKTNGPCVILAGAGTGKTYTIVEKIKYIINNKVYRPERVVCMTFSNEAANNLLSRVQRMFNFENGKEPVIKTFHAFSSDLLRRYGDKIGISKDFNILTPDESKVIMHKYLKVPAGNCHKYISSIGNAKDLGISLDSFMEYIDRRLLGFGISKIEYLEKKLEDLYFELNTFYLRKDKGIKKREITDLARGISNLLQIKKFVNAWRAYEKIKQIKNLQDYSDLNRNALRLVKENKEISGDYDYFIVDEFQDTNKVQLDLLASLAHHCNITVVGDLNQSIYRFRGAYNKNLDDFEGIFCVKESDIFSLDKSYRSSNKILRAAHKLIVHNYANPEDCFEVSNVNFREGNNIEVYEMVNAREEARKVVELVEEEVKTGRELEDICIMFRTHQQGRLIKKALEFKGIDYISVTKSSLLKERSIKTVIDYLTILNKLKKREKGGEQAWWDLVYQLDFAEEDLIKLGRFMKDNKDCDNISALMLSSLNEVGLSSSGKMIASILSSRIKMMIEEMGREVPELIKLIYNIAGLINGQKTREDRGIMLNLNKFFDLAKEHGAMYAPDLGSFLHYLDILDSLGIEISSSDSENRGVRLMTLHATKGLEYKTVIITNLAQKRFPIENFSSNPLIPVELSPEFDNLPDEDLAGQVYEYERKNQLFEERRLCYVAFTRAKERLIFTYSKEYGGRNYYPSQFLSEIDYKKNKDLSFFSDNEERFGEFAESNKGFGLNNVLNSNNMEGDIGKAFKNEDKGKKRGVSIEGINFSPSALLSFIECQKKFEYRYVYNMPEQKTVFWESLILGSFVHRILENGVKKNFKELKEFEDLGREMQMESDWESVDLQDALCLIKVFFERNKDKYDYNSKTERVLKMQIAGLNFIGFADRIDFRKEGLEIIDYKTGKSNVPPKARNWQLGYYALAASQLGKVRKITLDMLRHEKPLEFELDDKGNAVPVNSERMSGFNVFQVEEELVKTAHSIIGAYESGFKACSIEKNCEFCNEWVYGRI